MLSFKANQLDQLGEAFTRTLVEYLRREHPKAANIPEADLHSFVSAARERAKELGFLTEQHQCDVVEAAFDRGDGMWHDPGFHDIISRQFWTAEEKSRRIRRVFVGTG